MGEDAFNKVKFYKVSEVADRLRVSKMTVYRMIHSGQLEAARFGHTFRVPKRAVNEYLKDSFFEAV